MSTVMIPPTKIMSAVDITGDVNSTAVHTFFVDNIGIQVIWTGTPTGQFGIQVSNDATVSTTGAVSGGTWTTITGTYPAPAGSASNGFISLTGFCAAFLRLTYTHSSSSGTATAWLCGKAI